MPITTTTLQVTFVSESAAYDNTFGWYNSQTGMGGILFADVEQQGPYAPLSPGATVSFTVNTADLPYINFFLIPDGADHNDTGDLTGAIKVIQLSDGTWAVADVDAYGNVIYVHGRPDTLDGQGADALFTETSKNAGGIDYASSTVGPSQTAGTLGGDTADGPTGLQAWEDIAAKRNAHGYGQPGDADYNDAVFNIVALNHPPETNATSATGNEDTTVAITLSGTDDDGTVTSFRVTTLPANGTLYRDAALTLVIAAGSTVTASGNAATVYFKPNANFNGGASFQYAAIDDDGAQDASAATASITVTSVNDAPSGADRTLTINEDASYIFATSDFGFTDPSDTPANALLAVKITTLPPSGTLTDNGVAVSAGQLVSAADIAAGLVKFTPAANGNGAGTGTFTFQVQDNGGTASGGVDLDQSPNTMTINVTSVNDAPSGTTNTVSTNEDAAYTFAAADFGFTDPNDTPANALLAVTITTVPGGGSLTNNGVAVTAGQSVSVADINAGLLKFTPAANGNGAGYASFTFQVQDNGGTANGGVDLDQSPNTMTINVTSVNDAPSGTNNAVTTNEDIAYTFAAADFGFTDPSDTPANALLAVTITTLPGAGSLTNNGIAVTAGQSVSAADIAAGLLKFTPAANASGAAYAGFTFQVQDNGGIANGGVDTDPSPNTMTINVNSVNDAPAGADNTVNAGSVYVFSTADFSFSDPNDSPANTFAAVEITTLPGSGTLTNNGNPVNAGDFISVADISAGHLQFTAAGGANASFTFQVRDDGGAANGGVDLDQSPNTLTLIVNTPPVANDDSVAATEAGGVNNATPGHDPAGNVILGTGDAGNAQDTDAQDPSAALIVVAAGTGVEGSADNGTVGTAFSGLHGSLLLGSNGAYSYTLNQTDAAVQALHTAADTITDVFHYTIQDSGGLTDQATLIITIHGANDLPLAVNDAGSMTEDDGPTSFNVIANDAPDPDSTAANTISVGTITVVGPSGTTFVNSDAQAIVVANQIQLTLTNANFQQLALGEHATVTVAYTLTGDAGDTSSANLVVTVNGANDLPVAVDDSGAMTEDQGPTAFTVLGNDTPDPDHGAPNNVTAGAVSNVSAPAGDNIDAGDVIVSVNGSNQIVVTLGSDFQHLGEGESASFDVAYTLHGDQGGDLATATLHVTVTGANDAPVAQNFTFNGANSAIGNTSFVLDNGTGAAPTDPAGPQKTVSGSLLAGATDVDGPALAVVAETKATIHGSVIINADGDFTYLPNAGYTGNDSFTYTVTDGNTPTAGTDTKTVTITIAAPKVWYVDAANGSDITGDGTSDNPFATLTALNGGTGDGTTNDDVDGTGDIIFMYGGTYTGGIVLEDGQQLISKEHGLTVNATVLEAADGSSVTTINGTVTLASSPATANTIQGIDFGTTSGFALTGTNVGDAKVNTVTGGTINNTSGGAISINGSGTGMDLQLESVSSSGSSTNAISFSNARGAFNADGGTLSNAAGNTVSITGDGVNDDLAFTYDGAISDDGNVLVNITGQSGGTKTFNGALTDGAGAGGGIAVSGNTGSTAVTFTHSVSLNTGASTGVSFSGNGASTALNFNNSNGASNGLDITTTSGTGFSATGGGTVTVLDPAGAASNTIVSSSGTGLNITNTNIGAGNVTFEKISSGGGANDGIVLDGTGTAAGNGGLHVTGTGSAGSGGTIANKTGANGSTTSGIGIYLNNTKDVQLNWMQLNDFQNFGIKGSNVTGFTFDNSVLSGTNGNAAGAFDEAAISFNNLLGSASISNSNITNGFEYILKILNSSGTLNRLTVDNTDFGTNNTALGGDAFQIVASNTATVNVTVTNSGFTNAREDLFNAAATQTANMDVVFRDNSLSNNHTSKVSGASHILVSSTSTGNVTYDISHNTMTTGATGSAIAVAKGVPDSGSGGTMAGTINANTIGLSGVVGSGSEFTGILATALGSGTHTTAITNNTIYHYNEEGILLKANDNLTGGNSVLNATLTGNQVLEPDAFAFTGLWVIAGSGSGTENNVVNVLLGNISTAPVAGSPTGSLQNDFTAGDPFDFSDVFLDEGGSNSAINLSRAGSAAGTAEGVVQDDNVGTPSVFASGTVNLVNTTPPLPPPVPPLLAAAGGVASASGASGEHHLTSTELSGIVAAAIGRWADAGLSDAQLASLGGLQFNIVDLGGSYLGLTGQGHILIDDDAAGYGWFIDSTPLDDAEFGHAVSATQLQTDPSGAPAGQMDLLTVVMHEIGHALGLDHSHDASGGLMSDTLVTGERMHLHAVVFV